MNWQPIETAPRDGTEVLVCRVYEGGQARYAVAYNYDDGNGWRDMGDLGWAGMTNDDDNRPTHWMPLPEPPVNKSGEQMSQKFPNINCAMYFEGTCTHPAAPTIWFGLGCPDCIVAFPLSDRRVKPGCALQLYYPRPTAPVPPPPKPKEQR